MKLRKLGKILLLCGMGIVVVSLLLMLGIKVALDRAPHYQAEIKEWVHTQTGYHIAFRRVSPAFRWYGPELYFEQLELRSKDDRRVLARAEGGRVGADIWQFFRSGKLLAARIELDSPTIAVARVGPGAFALGLEIKLGGGDAAVPGFTLDELPAGILAIRHGVLTVQNWNAELPQLVLRDLTLDLSRLNSGITLTSAATLPDVLGGTLAVHVTATGVGELTALAWNAAARARGISFPGWKQLLPEYLGRLDAGSGEFVMAAHGVGNTLARADLDFAARGVATKLADGPSALFDQIGGNLTLTHAGDRWSLLGRKVQALQAGRRDPNSAFDIAWRHDAQGLLEMHARADYLRLDTLLPLTGLLPERALRERLRDLALTGEWRNAVIDLSRALPDDPWRLRVQGSFHGVGFAPVGRAPGLRGLSGSISGSESGGRVDLDSPGAVFSWPNELPLAVPLDALKTTLYWQRTPDELLVATPAFEIKTTDAGLHGKLAWSHAAASDSPVLTLAAVVENGAVANTRNYLPQHFIAPSAHAWLSRAFVTGRLSRADVVIQGPIRHFPFRDGTGVFLARCNIEGLNLDYREGWPALENMNVLAEFRNEGLAARMTNGRIGNIKLESGDARFADFKTGELEIRATASGDAADTLDYLRATPLDTLAEHAFSGVEARGPMQAKVNLFLPFKQFDQRRTLVQVRLNGVSLNRVGSTVTASELVGDADVDGAQVARADVRGRILGGAFQMSGHSPKNRPATRTLLEFRGNVSGEELHAALGLPANIPLNGETDWRGVLKLSPAPVRERSLRLTSTLAGIELKLPDPLSKPAAAALPTAVDVLWPLNAPPQVRASIGAVLRGAFALESDGTSSRPGHVALMFGTDEPVASDSQDFNVGGALERVDLAGWLKLTPADKNAKPLSTFLRAAKIQVAQLDYLGLSFLDVGLDLLVGDTALRIAVSGPNVVGNLLLPTGPAQAGPAAEPWSLQFERLKFVDEVRGDTLAGATRSGGDPHAIPAINFHAGEMIWGERDLGDVRATLTKLDDGIGLQQLTITGPVTSATARGEWRGKDQGLGRIEGTLVSTDVGGSLKQLGYAQVIDAKSGRVDYDLNWVGPPTSEALGQAVGHVQVALDKGEIVGLKPGAGRVLGLASLAALPRRLALDFSDLTDKGFAFDTGRGDFDLREGSAFTDNVLVKGPAAEIGLIGRVGLKNRDYDQTAVVTGSLGSSPLPLAGFVGGPVVGAAFLVFSQVFKQPLKGLTRGYYRITGNWDNPTVERIKNADAATAAAEAAR